MKRMTFLYVAGVCMLAAAMSVRAEAVAVAPTAGTNAAVAAKVQTLCPITNQPIDHHVYVDYDGKRIYMCCRSCLDAVKKDPAKYVKLLEGQGITLATAKPAEAPKAK